MNENQDRKEKVDKIAQDMTDQVTIEVTISTGALDILKRRYTENAGCSDSLYLLSAVNEVIFLQNKTEVPLVK